MKIIIKNNAEMVYLSNSYTARFPNKEFLERLKSFAGQVFEVDTNWMKEKTITTVEGHKIETRFIEEYIDDVRCLYKNCGSCGSSQLKEAVTCEGCGSVNFYDLLKENKNVSISR